MVFVRSYFGINEPLTSWTLLSSFCFQISADQCWSGKKRGKKVFNCSDVHFFGSTSYEIHILESCKIHRTAWSLQTSIIFVSYLTFWWNKAINAKNQKTSKVLFNRGSNWNKILRKFFFLFKLFQVWLKEFT